MVILNFAARFCQIIFFFNPNRRIRRISDSGLFLFSIMV